MLNYQDKSNWSLGNWNAWVAMGDGPKDRRKRLAEVPEQWRDSVKNHVQTVFAIKNQRGK